VQHSEAFLLFHLFQGVGGPSRARPLGNRRNLLGARGSFVLGADHRLALRLVGAMLGWRRVPWRWL